MLLPVRLVVAGFEGVGLTQSPLHLERLNRLRLHGQLLGRPDQHQTAFAVPADYLLVGHVEGTVVRLGDICWEDSDVFFGVALLGHFNRSLGQAHLGTGLPMMHSQSTTNLQLRLLLLTPFNIPPPIIRAQILIRLPMQHVRRLPRIVQYLRFVFGRLHVFLADFSELLEEIPVLSHLDLPL